MRNWLMLAGMLLAAAAGHACSCSGPGPVCSIQLRVSAIFRGTVVGRALLQPAAMPFKRADGTTVYARGGGKYRVRFLVHENFSGQPAHEVVIYTCQRESMCGFKFEDGAEYVVFTYTSPEDGELWTSRCSRTAKLTAGTDNESVLWMRGRSKAAPGSELLGRVLLPPGSPEQSVPSKISLDGPVKRTIVPDGSGRYSLKGLPAGVYTVAVMVPNGFSTQEAQTVRLLEKGCSEVVWYVGYKGRIQGRVVDVDGQPVTDLEMRLDREMPDQNGRRTEQQQTTDLDGNYEFSRVSPGEYLVVVVHPGSLTDDGYSSLYYPHSTSFEGAEVIKLAASASRNGVDFVLPRLRPTLPVRIRVVEPDGSAAPPGWMVFASVNNSRQSLPTRSALTGEDGWGTLPLFAGQDYSFTVALDRSHPGCGGGLRMLVKDGTEFGVLSITNPASCLSPSSAVPRPPQAADPL